MHASHDSGMALRIATWFHRREPAGVGRTYRYARPMPSTHGTYIGDSLSIRCPIMFYTEGICLDLSS